MTETTTTVAESEPVAGTEPQATEADQTQTAEGSANDNSTGTQPGGESDAGTTAAEGTQEGTKLDLSDDQRKWLENKGVDPEDPAAVVAAWHRAEQEFHKDRQDAKPKQTISESVGEDETVQAMQEASGADPEVEQLKRDVKEERFFRQNPEAVDHEDDIIAVGKRFPKLAAEFDLQTLWAIAKSERMDSELNKAKQEGRDEAKQTIAKQSVASVPNGNNQSPAAPVKADPFLAGFNQK